MPSQDSLEMIDRRKFKQTLCQIVCIDDARKTAQKASRVGVSRRQLA